jgi:hypothetical protein
VSACQQCNNRDLHVRDDEMEVRRLARVLARTEKPATVTRTKMQLAAARRQLDKSRQWRDEHQSECGVLV